MLTEDEWNRDAARDYVVLMSDPTTGAIRDIGIIGDSGAPELTVGKGLAVAIAARLLEAAAQVPDAPKLLRRPTDVDRRLRALDG